MLRLSVVALLASLVACGGGGATAVSADEPQTAREKLAAEEKKGEKDEPSTRPVGKWRYSGDRGSCFYRLKQKCFKTEAAACAAAKCGKAACEVEGAAPARVSCKKSDEKSDD